MMPWQKRTEAWFAAKHNPCGQQIAIRVFRDKQGVIHERQWWTAGKQTRIYACPGCGKLMLPHNVTVQV